MLASTATPPVWLAQLLPSRHKKPSAPHAMSPQQLSATLLASLHVKSADLSPRQKPFHLSCTLPPRRVQLEVSSQLQMRWKEWWKNPSELGQSLNQPMGAPAAKMQLSPVATLAPTLDSSASLTPLSGPGWEEEQRQQHPGNVPYWRSNRWLGFGLMGAVGTISSAMISPMSTISTVGEAEEEDGVVVDKDEVLRKDQDNTMKVDEERSVNVGDQNDSKANSPALLTMKEIKDRFASSSCSVAAHWC
ncbi:hypothetical protein BJ165DRAFT_1409854 [Panaeolus papilionaceus]|nr:hypothetical protein BJ165DRAFT_1409854 [Panaeolus papilionaceus]